MTLFTALFSHYRRHPLQLAALALMILVATTLWSGVRQLTEQARTSLAQSEQVMAGRQQVVRVDGAGLTVGDFAVLRRAGVCVMPWLEVPRPDAVGLVIGIDRSLPTASLKRALPLERPAAVGRPGSTASPL